MPKVSLTPPTSKEIKVKLPTALHVRLKMEAAKRQRTITDLVIEGVALVLNHKEIANT